MQGPSAPLRLHRSGADTPPAGERLLVSLATYNERGNLADLVAAIHAELPRAEILVIDDHSPDASGGFRCYRVAKLREANLERVRSRGYSFQQEVLFRCHRAGCRIGETPIVFENRRAGLSKVSLRESVRSLGMLGWLGVRATLG